MCYFAPVGERSAELWSIAISLSVCVSVREHIYATAEPIVPNFCADPLWPWFGPPLAALRAIRYVLPVLWTTSRLPIMGAWRCVEGWTFNLLSLAAFRYLGGVWSLWSFWNHTRHSKTSVVSKRMKLCDSVFMRLKTLYLKNFENFQGEACVTGSTMATSTVHSKLDYCKSIYFNLPKSQINRFISSSFRIPLLVLSSKLIFVTKMCCEKNIQHNSFLNNYCTHICPQQKLFRKNCVVRKTHNTIFGKKCVVHISDHNTIFLRKKCAVRKKHNPFFSQKILCCETGMCTTQFSSK